MRKEDKPGNLVFYCSKCLGATTAIQKDPLHGLKCVRHDWTDVVVMREMIRPKGFPYYVSVGPKNVKALS